MEFADNMVLFAKDDVMMQDQVDLVLFRLTKCGLNVKQIIIKSNHHFTNQNALH